MAAVMCQTVPGVLRITQLDLGSRLPLDLNIGTFNNRTLSQDYRIDYLINELDKVKLDILTVTETKRKEELHATWKDGTQVFLGAAKIVKNNARQGGVGFIVRPLYVDKIKSCSILSERIATLVIQIDKTTTLKIISCYSPTLQASDDEIESFYTELSKALEHKESYNFICGDFNAKLGPGIDGEKFIGPFGLGTRNERGKRLAEFAESERLYIMNSFFKKRKGKRWMWQSPKPWIKNEIDFILTDCKRLLQNTETIGKKYFETCSDHRPVRANIHIDKKLEEKIRAISNHTHQKTMIDDKKYLQTVQKENWDLGTDIDADYKKFISNMKNCKKQSTVSLPATTRNRLSSETLELLANV